MPAGLSDAVLEAMLCAGAGRPPGSRGKTEPDWTGVHHELRRPGVTLMLLWEEYRQAEPDGYGYSRWCELYRTWEGRLSPTMRQAHPAGERMFVDYAGQTVELYVKRRAIGTPDRHRKGTPLGHWFRLVPVANREGPTRVAPSLAKALRDARGSPPRTPGTAATQPLVWVAIGR